MILEWTAVYLQSDSVLLFVACVHFSAFVLVNAYLGVPPPWEAPFWRVAPKSTSVSLWKKGNFKPILSFSYEDSIGQISLKFPPLFDLFGGPGMFFYRQSAVPVLTCVCGPLSSHPGMPVILRDHRGSSGDQSSPSTSDRETNIRIS